MNWVLIAFLLVGGILAGVVSKADFDRKVAGRLYRETDMGDGVSRVDSNDPYVRRQFRIHQVRSLGLGLVILAVIWWLALHG